MAIILSKINLEEMIMARRSRAVKLLEQGIEPQEIDVETWIIPSQTGNGSYTVENLIDHWRCTCPDYEYRGVECKHIHVVKIWRTLKEQFHQTQLRIRHLIKPKKESVGLTCKFCHSENIIKYGMKNGKQNYYCKSCHRKFVNNIDFEGMKYDPKVIALTLDLYFKGVSLRKISHHLKQFYNLDICHKSVYNWIEKYVGIMNDYVNTIAPDVGNVWHTDELMVKIDGSWEYLWNSLDEQTRFHLASVVSKERKVKDARNAFQNAKKNAHGRKPKYLVTDGLHTYERAVRKEFNTLKRETEHIHNVGLKHHINNNHVERLHGTIRDREKTMRGLKIETTPIVEGHRLYYNFIRPHEALDGKTPSEEAGISIEGDNKWLSLMHKAVQYRKTLEVAP